ncbi:unnamed protein product [Closterium sp. Yama58-4]|nr:unnamed protein product [Closterium sp. Yama58-4]
MEWGAMEWGATEWGAIKWAGVCDPEAASIVFNSGCPLTMVPLEVTHTALLYPSVAARISSCPPHCPICAPSSTHAAPPPPSLATPCTSAADATPSTHGGADGGAVAVAASTPHTNLTPLAASAGGCLGCYRGRKLRQTVSALMHFFARTYLEVFGFQHPPLHDPCALAFLIAPSLFNVCFPASLFRLSCWHKHMFPLFSQLLLGIGGVDAHDVFFTFSFNIQSS